MRYSGIGGQAVMEGVMMKNKNRYAVAVRKPDHEIEVMTKEYKGIVPGEIWQKIPLVRGVLSFIDSLVLGMSTLMYSASFFEDEDESEKEKQKDSPEKMKAKENAMMGGTVALSVILAIAIFMILPYYLSVFCSRFIASDMIVAVLEGILRLAIFIGYIVVISKMKEIQRVFMYHGAEHKCINCIEHGMELNVENVRRSSKEHKRCGTSFLMFVVILSVVLFLFIRVDSHVLRLVLRLALVPVIAGVSYELLRVAGRSDNPVINLISKPGLWMQGLTTKEPDDEMIEVGIASVEAVFDWRAYIAEIRAEEGISGNQCCCKSRRHRTESAGDEAMTYREARMQAAKQLAAAGVENEAAESWFLMEAVCGISRSFYLLHEQEAMDPVQEQVYFALTRQRCGRMPLQYLTGEQEFMGLPFCVNEHVLIPRQDTEVLVEEAIRVIQKEMPEAAVLDLCTGSGCIGISIQSFCSNTQVTAADISEDALKVAQKNAKENQVPVEFVHSDLFKEISGSYDMIVSNPPYIPSKVIETLMPEVRDHEPIKALDGKEDGLYFYRRITEESVAYLKPGGYLLYEIGHDQGEAVSSYMRENGFDEIEVIRDLAGLDRVVRGRR